jgi:hypothetical protein
MRTLAPENPHWLFKPQLVFKTVLNAPGALLNALDEKKNEREGMA